MKYFLYAAVVLGAGMMLWSQGRAKGFKRISMADAAEAMKTETDFVLVDVRTPGEFADGHIPGAINIPNETIGKKEISVLPNKAQKIFVYCRSGSRSRQAAGKLVELGYTEITEIGGIMSWTGAIER